MIAGPVYLGAGIAQGLVRDTFDLRRHGLSLLANGPWGWVQVLNLTLTGAMVLAAAAGLRRVRRDGHGSVWTARLVAGLGIGMIVAAVFKADPMDGFLGTPAGPPDDPTVHGTVHMLASMAGFACLLAAMFVHARHEAKAGRRSAAILAPVAVLVAAVGMASTTVAGVYAGVIIMFVWLSTTSLAAYRTVAS
jgi:hypothetical protein